MKTLKFMMVLVLMISIGSGAGAQTTQSKKAAKEAAIKKSVEGKTYTFMANQATPLGGGPVILNDIYDLRVKSDSVISFLPYFGRAYFDVGYNPSDVGMKFTSTNFKYKSIEKTKGGWEITIKPADVKNVISLVLRVSKDGYASLYIASNNRDAITYDGYLE